MNNLFEHILGPDGRPVQRNIEIKLVPDADGRARIMPVRGEAIVMSPDGSLDRVVVSVEHFHHCGCPMLGAPGGRCAMAGCGNMSCPACARRCAHCLMPICLEHTEVLVVTDRGVDLCPRCHAEIKRKQLVGRVARALLEPFVNTDSRNEP